MDFILCKTVSRRNFVAKKTKIVAFTGRLREHSYTRRVLKTAIAGAENAGAGVTLIDLRDFPMPIYNPDEQEKNGFPENAIRLQEVLNAHDGFLIATPEYNGSIPGGMKNAIDWTSRKSDKFGLAEVFRGSVAAIMTASPGAFGGIRCLSHLRGVLSILQVNVLPSEIAVPFVNKMFEGESEEMTDEKMKGILRDLGESLADMLGKTHGEIETVESEASNVSR